MTQCKMASMEPRQCLCGGTAVLLSQNDREVAVTVLDRTAQLHVCQSCGHVFFWPLPTESELADYYNGPWNAGSTHSIEDSFDQWIERLDGYAPQRTFVEAILRLREKHFGMDRPVVVHDASCGFGALVAKLNTLGFDASGSDIDGESIQAARERGNLKVHQCHFSRMSELIPQGADIITCFHSVEHYIDPVAFFRKVKLGLRPGGFFLMAVPNGAYLPARLDHFKKFDWCFYPGHLQYFTPYSAAVLLAKAGLRVTDTFSYAWDWPSSQTDWLLTTLTGLPASQLPAPERLIDALADNLLLRDLRVVAINDGVIVRGEPTSERRYIGFDRSWRTLPAIPSALETPTGKGVPENSDQIDRRLADRPEPIPHNLFAVIGLFRTLWLIVSPRRFFVKCRHLGLWFQVVRRESALRIWCTHFDASYYVETYPDIRAAGVDPLLHFLLCGGRELRNPSPLFDTAVYVSHYPDVRSARLNPLLHFAVFGHAENRSIKAVIDKPSFKENPPVGIHCDREPAVQK
jgi:2-polyprenyl-3-methyl-5-hydroxy-6-metoxy-1,4-benzoquinol methylase